VTVAESYEGLEAMNIVLSGGNVRVKAENNGLAATMDVLETELAPMDFSVIVSGGTLHVTAEQAIKTDGIFLLQDGGVFLHGLSPEDDALEAGLGGSVQGGMLLVTGTLGSDWSLALEGDFGAILHRLASPAAGGTPVEIQNADGEICFRYTPADSFAAVCVAYNGLVYGESYQLSLGSETASVVLEEAVAAAPAASAEMDASGPMGTGF